MVSQEGQAMMSMAYLNARKMSEKNIKSTPMTTWT